ncbi:hypothetical protein PVAP13_9KG575400 [Panicum virgatum]|uniref:Uncharacterized protein n=1 Tax=Panicum virgatum TaxID=38727 RepID=A0A8T0NYY4_PANVG|nr:hypothetical protein PVAP13_9KG575400 [Panicum virgatum]
MNVLRSSKYYRRWAGSHEHGQKNRPCPVSLGTCRSSGRPISTPTRNVARRAARARTRRRPPHTRHTDDDASSLRGRFTRPREPHRPSPICRQRPLSPHVPLTGAPRATSPRSPAAAPALFNPAAPGIPSAPRNNNKTRSHSRSSRQRNPGVPDRLHFRPRGQDPFRSAILFFFLLGDLI